MKTKNVFLTFILAMVCLPLAAGTPRVDIHKLTARSNSGKLVVSMEFVLDELDLKADQLMAFQPVITSADGSREMPLTPFLVTGRRAHIYHERAGSDAYPDAVEMRRRNGSAQTYAYTDVAVYQPWMKGATLAVMQDLCACGDKLEQATAQTVRIDYDPFDEVQYAFVTPKVEQPKVREERGSAFLDFRVNRTEIDPQYRKNPEELAKIIRTIDLVKNDTNVLISNIDIHGFASPEGSYANNVRLAKERSNALKDYVRVLHRLPDNLFRVEFTAEDWDGLRRWVEASDLPMRGDLLARIDAKGEPDTKEAGIRQRYPEVYRRLLSEVYPGLRHADYRVEYVVKPFTVEEARRVFRTKPKQLSLNELFLLGNSYEQGSDAYNEVFETAVRMFPTDETANLNAANIALSRRDVASAEKFLAKAGNSPAAVHARGLLAILKGDYDTARQLLGQAAASGMAEAQHNLDLLKSIY